MEPLFKNVVVGLVPQPRQIPPPPFRKEDLQRLYVDITRDYPYQQFSFLPADAGAQLVNPPEDAVVIQPGLLQIQAKIELTTEAVREKCMAVFRATVERLNIESFLQCGIKVVAHVAAPGASPDAKAFVAQQLMQGQERVEELPAGFFGGGVKYRRLDAEREDNLLIEPFIHDNEFVFIDYDVARVVTGQPFQGIDHVATWLDEDFSFVSGHAMSLLQA